MFLKWTSGVGGPAGGGGFPYGCGGDAAGGGPAVGGRCGGALQPPARQSRRCRRRGGRRGRAARARGLFYAEHKEGAARASHCYTPSSPTGCGPADVVSVTVPRAIEPLNLGTSSPC
eukprot:1612673-Pyramimonas_sp.AAC.3